MVKIALQIKATLENIVSVRTHTDYNYFLKIKCTNCSEESDKWHDVNEKETFPSKTAKSDVNFLVKCKLCSRENSLDIIPKSTGRYTIFQSKFIPNFYNRVLFIHRYITTSLIVIKLFLGEIHD